MGAPRAVTVEGAVDLNRFTPASDSRRLALRQRYNLAPDHLVCGVVGSLQWSDRQQYCYGLELIETLKYLTRTDVSLLIVGDGDGKNELERRVPAAWADRVVFTGRVSPDEVAETLNAMDVGFITQTLDGLGNFRLTTKLPEYLATGLPVAMSPTPGYYDYVGRSAGWSLPAHHPSADVFHRECASWLDSLHHDEVRARRPVARRTAEALFSYDRLTARFAEFMASLLNPSPRETTSTNLTAEASPLDPNPEKNIVSV
jgi:hypothetical protein